jgi:transposase
MAELARVAERKRAVALARHYREVEGLSGKEIARRLGRSHATIRSYFYDPDATKASAVKERYRGQCESCGAATSGGDGPGRARRRCVRCR